MNYKIIYTIFSMIFFAMAAYGGITNTIDTDTGLLLMISGCVWTIMGTEAKE